MSVYLGVSIVQPHDRGVNDYSIETRVRVFGLFTTVERAVLLLIVQCRDGQAQKSHSETVNAEPKVKLAALLSVHTLELRVISL